MISCVFLNGCVDETIVQHSSYFSISSFLNEEIKQHQKLKTRLAKEAIRDEVKELRALLEQYVPQSKQKNEMPQQATQASVAAQNQNIPKQTEASPQPSALSFNSSSVAQVQLYCFLLV